MLEDRKPHKMQLTLGNVFNDVTDGIIVLEDRNFLSNKEGFDLITGHCTLFTVEVSLISVMSYKTVPKH